MSARLRALGPEEAAAFLVHRQRCAPSQGPQEEVHAGPADGSFSMGKIRPLRESTIKFLC